MKTKTITIGSNNTAPVTFNGDVVVADQIKDSFNRVETSQIDASVKELLQLIVQAVAAAAGNAPDDVARQLGQDVETLSGELTSAAPRRPWHELSIEGLRTAAKTLGDIGTPILELTSRLVPLLG